MTTAIKESTLLRLGKLVKFSHTIFALPFALSMAVVVSEGHPFSWGQGLLLLAALVSARTAAMAYNRIIDRSIDAKNPRTLNREIPRGVISLHAVYVLLMVSCGLFLLASFLLGTHCFVLAPFVLLVLLGYSWAKRFTHYCHFILGVGLALAPGGVWYALTGEWSMVPLWMMGGVLFWVAGFDIIYSCQDVTFDRQNALHSVPARIGVSRALFLAKLLHCSAVILFIIFGFVSDRGFAYYGGVTLFAFVLLYEHRLVKEDDLSKIDMAFFTRNGQASVLYLVGTIIDTVW